MRALVNISQTVFDWVLPHSCLLCRDTSTDALCQRCFEALPWLGSCCSQCALPLETAGICAHCLKRAPEFDRCVAAFRFADPVGPLINQFKSRRNFQYGSMLCNALLHKLRDQGELNRAPEIIVPVPLHWRRVLTRGFNQASFIAVALSRALTIPVAPLLRRPVPTPKQQGLKRKQRLRNLEGAFRLSSAATLPRHVAVVDDVLTTGATAEAVSRVLKTAGVQRVDIWALARTPSPQP